MTANEQTTTIWPNWQRIFEAKKVFMALAMGLTCHALEASPLETWRMLREGRGTPAQYLQFLKKHNDWPDKNGIITAGEKVLLEKPMQAKRDATWFDHHPPTTFSGIMRYVEALHVLKSKKTRDVVRQNWRMNVSVSDEKEFYNKWKSYLKKDDVIFNSDNKIRQYRLMMQGEESILAAKEHTTIYGCVVGFIKIKEHLKAKRYNDAEILLKETLPIKTEPLPMPDAWWKVCHAVARECIERKDYQTALEFVEKHGLPEGTEDWAQAEWTRGWLLWNTDQFTKAYQVFSYAFDKVKAPMSRARMAFWAAESAKCADMKELSTEWYKKSATYGLTFYGQLSARCLNQPISDLFWKEQSTPPASLKKDDLYHVITGKEELTKEEKLLFFSAWVKRLHRTHQPTDTIFSYAVHLAKKKGDDALAVAIMRLVNFVCPKLVRSAFPTLPGVAADVAVIANAIAWRESGFDPDIVSSAGAIGLMQMMPGTFEKEKRQMPDPKPTGTVNNPKANVAVGTFLIKRLMNLYPHIVLALSAYNAGEAAANRWREVFGEPPAMDGEPVALADWIEKIPYYETRNYVQRVLEKMCVYEQIMNDKRN